MPEANVVAVEEKNKYYPMTGTYKYVRDSFWSAGQDSYTLPPAQDQDLYSQLINVQPVMRGTLDRRWGYQLFGYNPAMDLNYMRMAGYRIDATNSRYIVALAGGSDANQAQIDIYNEDGTIHDTNIGNIRAFTVNNGSIPFAIDSRDYLYLLINGAANLFKKYDGTNVTNWGAAAPTTGITLTGASGPPAPGDTGATAPTAASTSSFGANDWTNPSNIEVADGNYATTVLSPTAGSGSQSFYIKASGFGFAIPGTATIRGIKVKVTHKQISGTSAVYDAQVILDGTGISGSHNKGSFSPWSAFAETFTYGGATDTWGATGLTPTNVNDASFGVQVAVDCTLGPGNGATAGIDFISLEVFYQDSGSGGGAGNLTLSIGRQYCGVYRDSSTGHITSLTPFSASTGPLTSQTEGLALPGALSDPQFDLLDILATSDGGDQTTLYLLDTVPAAQATYTDNIPETQLLTQTIYQQNDINGNPHGCLNNIGPNTSTFLGVKHRGRIYLAAGHSVYFSKNIDELTTVGSGGVPFIAGKWEESFPPTYLFDVSEWAETISGMFSDGVTLYIATERTIRRLIGDGPQNFQKPEVVFNETGVLNQEVWKPVFREGQPIGTMWLTPDFRVLLSDMNTYHDVGHPIQDILNSINTTILTGPDTSSVNGVVSQTCRAMFFSSGAYDLYVLAVPVGDSTLPDTLLVYNLRTSRWTVWTPADLTTAMFFNINASGQPQVLFAAGGLASPFLYQYRDNLVQDRVNNTPVNIPVTIQTSWLHLGDPMMRKALNMSNFITSDPTNVTLTIEGARTGAEFTTPFTIVNGAPLSTGPLGDTNVYLAGAITKYQWYRFTYADNGNSQGPLIVGSAVHEVVPIHRVT